MSPTSVAAPQVGDTLNQAWKNDKSKFGLKMLQKMGWTEGKGLGKNEDGVSEHVKVAKKSNNLGLGATHDASGAAGWASAAVNFNGVLEALGKAYGRGGSDAAVVVKGDKRMKKKLKKAEKKKKRRVKNDEDAANSSSSEGVAARAVSSCPSRARRIRSKDVTGFSAADLQAILGKAATTANPSLPSYPVIGGGCGGKGAVASATESKIVKRKSSKTKSKDIVSPLGSPHRARTRSMDETAAEPAVVAGKRPRNESFDHTEEGDDGVPTATRRKSNKAGRAGEGEEGTVAATERSSKDKRRQKKSKKDKKGLSKKG